MNTRVEQFGKALEEITRHIEQGILPFWLANGIDRAYGGYLTCFDAEGKAQSDTDKYIVTQTRMIWGMSAFYRYYPDNEQIRQAAEQGVKFFIDHFWDREHGGWYWKVKRDGTLIDDGKLTYGQTFAIYALSEYTLATGDPLGLEYAEKTFDLLQKFAADNQRGGYLENLNGDWSVADAGFYGGDRKSLDIHMHVMEAFTTLAQCSDKEIHLRKLEEVIGVLLTKMIHPVSGCGLNQFDVDFNPIPART